MDPFDYFDEHPSSAKRSKQTLSNEELQLRKLDKYFKGEPWDDGEYEDIE